MRSIKLLKEGSVKMHICAPWVQKSFTKGPLQYWDSFLSWMGDISQLCCFVYWFCCCFFWYNSSVSHLQSDLHLYLTYLYQSNPSSSFVKPWHQSGEVEFKFHFLTLNKLEFKAAFHSDFAQR